MKHVLVIEDVPIIAMMIQDELADLGFSIATAATQAQAIVLAEAHCPDLIIADSKLEQGSGVEAVRKICHDGSIPVIFMTGDRDAVRLPLDAAVILEKPFSTAQLRSGINLARPILIESYDPGLSNDQGHAAATG